MDINLRLYRSTGLHGEIRMGDARVDLDDVGTFLLSDAVDRIIGRLDRSPRSIKLNGQIVNLKEAERAVISHALGFNRTIQDTADALGISRKTLWERRKEFGLPMKDRP